MLNCNPYWNQLTQLRCLALTDWGYPTPDADYPALAAMFTHLQNCEELHTCLAYTISTYAVRNWVELVTNSQRLAKALRKITLSLISEYTFVDPADAVGVWHWQPDNEPIVDILLHLFDQQSFPHLRTFHLSVIEENQCTEETTNAVLKYLETLCAANSNQCLRIVVNYSPSEELSYTITS